MKKLSILVTMAAIFAVLGADHTNLLQRKAATVHASRVAGVSGGGVTGMQIQNLDSVESATITAEFFRRAHPGRPVSVLRPDVPAGGATNIFLPGVGTLSRDAYAAIVTADRRIAAIARTDWLETGGAAIYSDVFPGLDVSVPLAVRDYLGTCSLIAIQNTDTAVETQVITELYRPDSTSPIMTHNISIAPGSPYLLDLCSDPAFEGVSDNTPYGFVGSMRVLSTAPVGVQSLVNIATSDKAVYGFEGVPSEFADDTLYAPLIRHRFYNYDTGISVMSPYSDVEVTVEYIGSEAGGQSTCGGERYSHGPITIGAGSSHVFYQGPGGGHGLPPGCVGSAVIRSSPGIVLAVVNDSLNFNEESAAYNAVSAEFGATEVALPLIRREHLDPYRLTTGIQVMNIGSDPANIEIQFSDADGNVIAGCGAPCEATVGSHGSHTFYPGGDLDIVPPDSYGSAVVTSDEPVVVIVNDVSATGTMDSSTYNGIMADGY